MQDRIKTLKQKIAKAENQLMHIREMGKEPGKAFWQRLNVWKKELENARGF